MVYGKRAHSDDTAHIPDLSQPPSSREGPCRRCPGSRLKHAFHYCPLMPGHLNPNAAPCEAALGPGEAEDNDSRVLPPGAPSMGPWPPGSVPPSKTHGESTGLGVRRTCCKSPALRPWPGCLICRGLSFPNLCSGNEDSASHVGLLIRDQ